MLREAAGAVIVHINHISQSKKPKGNQRSPQSELAGLVTGSSDVARGGGRPRRAAGAVAAHPPRLDPVQDQLPRSGHRPADDRRRRDRRCRWPRSPSICARPTPRGCRDELARAVQSASAPAPDANADNHVYPGRLHAVSRLPDLGLQPAVLAAPRRLGGGVGQGLRGGAAGRRVGRESSAGGRRRGRRLLDAAARSRQRAASCPPEIVGAGDRRRLRRARRGSGSTVQGARRRSAAPAIYSRLQFLLGDYSPTSARARAGGGRRTTATTSAASPLDALNPFKALVVPTASRSCTSTSRTSTTTCRSTSWCAATASCTWSRCAPYLNGAAARPARGRVRRRRERAARRSSSGCSRAARRASIRGERGVAFWRRVWDALRLEERLRALDERDEAHVPPGLNRTHLEDLLAEAPDDMRFHISRGAAESFANTLPLLHPRGYLQVQDIFVSDMDDYRQGFRGPGQARRLARDLGQRRAAASRRRARRVRRALRAVPVPARDEDQRFSTRRNGISDCSRPRPRDHTDE